MRSAAGESLAVGNDLGVVNFWSRRDRDHLQARREAERNEENWALLRELETKAERSKKI